MDWVANEGVDISWDVSAVSSPVTVLSHSWLSFFFFLQVPLVIRLVIIVELMSFTTKDRDNDQLLACVACVLSSRAHERRAARKIKTAPAPISSRFLCPRPPGHYFITPNQNRHATQANQLPDNCASRFKGAWWYNGCHYFNLNGLDRPGKIDNRVICWYCWKKACHSAKRSEMKIRPKRFLDILVLRVSGMF